MKDIYEKTYKFYTAPLPHDLLNIFQDIADLHSLDLGMSRDDLIREYNAFWMIVRTYYQLNKPLEAGEYLVRSWHRGVKGIILYRDFDLIRDGELVGEGVQAWIIVDFDTKKIFRPANLPLINCSPGIPGAKDVQLNKLKAPDGEFKTGFYTVTKDDIDINGHMNNVRYAYIVAQALGCADIAELQINYVDECFEGDTIELHISGSGGKFFVHGQDASGNARFEATAMLF